MVSSKGLADTRAPSERQQTKFRFRAAPRLTALPRRYERRTESAYWYDTPTLKYSAQLEVSPTGLMRKQSGASRSADTDGGIDP